MSSSSQSSSLVSLQSSTTTPYLRFSQLEKDTDLDERKPNFNHELEQLLAFWLNEKKKNDIFGSFRTANLHTDCLGEVDVISDAEHIKKLLKVPFNKQSQISMIVHRAGRTILIDEFDVHSHLLRLEKNEWAWFRDFFLDTILRNITVKHFYKKNKSRNELINKDRFVKFLCQSVEAQDESSLSKSQCINSMSDESISPPPHNINNLVKNNTDSSDNNNNKSLNDNDLNDPQQADNTNETSFNKALHRHVLWTFENIKMLIGSDLPIFGDEQHPAVSLRLRDMHKPINVLTGIDYWLDNLMCNVPELAMCYHLDGIVQSYELIKTEDIPYREGSNFPPTVIRDLATNLLSFLKSNATKEGHTYWLFKGPDDDIVKLYDLTSLCETNRDDNPYTLPVALLLYKMASNMVTRSDHDTRSKESGTIRTLLKHCLNMLDPNKFPEYYCAAAYMMSDLYIDDNVSEQSWTSDGSEVMDPDSLNDDLLFENEKEFRPYTTVDINTLVQPQQHRFKNIPDMARLGNIHGTLNARASQALKYLVEALRGNAIHRHSQANNDMNSQSEQDQCQQKSKLVVPLQYKPTRTSSKILIDNKNRLTDDTRLKALILHKAAAAYFCLADGNEKLKHYGLCLRSLRLALKCHSAKIKLQISDTEAKKLLSYIMSIAGDCRRMIAHTTSSEEIDKYREQYNLDNEIDKEFEKVTSEITGEQTEFSWVSELTPMIDRNLFAAVHSYEYAINLVKNLGDNERKRLNLLTKRFGNVRNEMGCFYMNKCEQAVKSIDQETSKEVKELFRKSFESFDSGIQAFESINDVLNIALLYNNLGRLMRLYAQFYAPIVNGTRGEFSQQERQYYNKAFDYYLKGLKLVENRGDLHKTLSWELSGAYYTYATMLQDYAPLSTHPQEDIEKEVIDSMTKSLKYLEIETLSSSSDRNSLATYRAATIHHRLASLLHNALRHQDSKIKRKHLRSLASLHYQKALKLFSVQENPLEYLRVLLEEVALADYELQNATENPSRFKYAQQGLKAAFQCQECIEIIEHNRSSEDSDDYTEKFSQEAYRLLTILNGRIQSFLKEIVKISKTTTVKKKSNENENTTVFEDYKEMYNIALRLNEKSTTFPRDLLQAFERMKKIYDKHSVTIND
ncbi:unnamed protein product [Didymodactylos carnosus]|uniref:Erythroid differentiation-related factor 1 n=1 Tax=Didymodactylos carnosus TaxID=1234261 RepID=A0A813RRX1_9BILA|nr:unnamed protein product [Didymodactylos carnosus]CAF0923441.1 unnamed protein product [Didymodactylos carnosus]CAF3568702.1 unnamed protein product [Didymodactylos carnosus]CAF3700604.1 unnamed protein product [Didymodactylos carnosus]